MGKLELLKNRVLHRRRSNRRELDDEISAVLEEMADKHADTPEYAKMADNVQKLCEAKACEPPEHPHAAQIVGIAGSIGCLLLIMNYEKTDILATKALSFMPKR